MMSKPSRKATGRLILCVGLSYILFSFCVEAGLLNCINCNPVPRGTRNHSSRGALNSVLTSANSGLQLDLEIALSGVSAKVQPHGLLQPGRRCVETSDDVIEEAFTIIAAICRALFYARQAFMINDSS